MNEVIVKKDKVSVCLEWAYSNDAELVEAVRNAQELIGLIEKDEQDEQNQAT